ncbi:hypothetical protein AVW16_06885 [Crenobacter luteus]|uniref:Uncharacterized protein n=1 Tax=Crenobacter luteus TaxID=1452487 RepID=A0A165FTY9_9NEIS|nr:hypothetical protein AVW16_06885 [Crenobacter luteus]
MLTRCRVCTLDLAVAADLAGRCFCCGRTFGLRTTRLGLAATRAGVADFFCMLAGPAARSLRAVAFWVAVPRLPMACVGRAVRFDACSGRADPAAFDVGCLPSWRRDVAWVAMRPRLPSFALIATGRLTPRALGLSDGLTLDGRFLPATGRGEALWSRFVARSARFGPDVVVRAGRGSACTLRTGVAAGWGAGAAARLALARAGALGWKSPGSGASSRVAWAGAARQRPSSPSAHRRRNALKVMMGA